MFAVPPGHPSNEDALKLRWARRRNKRNKRERKFNVLTFLTMKVPTLGTLSAERDVADGEMNDIERKLTKLSSFDSVTLPASGDCARGKLIPRRS